MKERYDVEIPALLAALSDSQQMSRVLRLENNESWGKIQIWVVTVLERQQQ